MRTTLAVLEDDERRLEAMRRILRRRMPEFDVVAFDVFEDMIRFLEQSLSQLIVISLDHDLPVLVTEDGARRDAGSGRDVADHLASKAPACPILIHSTNEPAALGMERVLREIGWRTERVAPYGDLDWIPEIWLPAIRRLALESSSQ